MSTMELRGHAKRNLSWRGMSVKSVWKRTLKRTYVKGGGSVCGGSTWKTNRYKQGGGGSKIGNSEWTYLLKPFTIRNIKTAVKNLLKSEFFSAIFMFLIVESFRKWVEVKKHIFLYLRYWYSFEFFELNSNIFLWHTMRQYSKNICQR